MNYTLEDQLDYYATELELTHEIVPDSIEVTYDIFKNRKKYTSDYAMFHYLDDIECTTDDAGNGIIKQTFYNDDAQAHKYIDVEIRYKDYNPVEIISHEEIYFD